MFGYSSKKKYYTLQEHRERAAEFYKKVLRLQRNGSHRAQGTRVAAIGLPAAMQNGSVKDHVRRFVQAALADGTAVDDLVLLAFELERQMKDKRRDY